MKDKDFYVKEQIKREVRSRKLQAEAPKYGFFKIMDNVSSSRKNPSNGKRSFSKKEIPYLVS